MPVRAPTKLEPQWYLNKKLRQGDTGITNQKYLLVISGRDDARVAATLIRLDQERKIHLFTHIVQYENEQQINQWFKQRFR
ncbi:MAG: hypothetical protein EZS28_003775 [Streblomastix strix]|uniref:Uncharacterized protein n=1 Tax=Streblomastix strix TaxID=222440 RepID=A0A5J4X0E5_9EUKA|nr:MAG: hypothetical protein EZS28_003775 [Streblomastix strix]